MRAVFPRAKLSTWEPPFGAQGPRAINFTLHFHLARRDLGRPAAAVGAMLPDLWRMADRHVRPAQGAVESGGLPRLEEVLAGVAHHTRADAAFHASLTFRDGERAMARDLASVGAPRLSLFGHIAWELCLDGALVRREGDALAAELCAGIACALEPVAGEPALHAAARLHPAARKGCPLPAPFAARMARILAELEGRRWIAGYAHGAVVADRLEGIRGRLGFEAMEPAKRATLAALLDGAIERASGALDELVAMPV